MIRVGLRCDATAAAGVGHLMRCLALAEELTARGVVVSVLGRVDVPWARALVTVPVHPAPQSPLTLAFRARSLELDVMVLDSYDLDRDTGAVLSAAGVATMAIVDTENPTQNADLYLNPNLGAVFGPLPGGATGLAGVSYALLRDAVRSLRPAAPTAPPVAHERRPASPAVAHERRAPRVLGFFGGTDPTGAASVLAQALLATEVACEITMVSALPLPGPVITIPPTAGLPALITRADLVVSAAGGSTWELLCLGAPTALVWVAPNQEPAYTQATARGLVAGLGPVSSLDTSAVETLRQLLESPEARSELAARGWAAVDGAGRERAANALLTLV